MIAIFLLIGTVGLDQLTKIMVKRTMMLGESIPVLGNVVRLTYIRNPGIAFGIRVSNNTVFTIFSVLASIGVLVFLYRHWKEGRILQTGLCLILGGAVGNLIDRIFFGEVVDFIDVGFQHIRWPVFNIADSAVVIGMIILFFTVFRKESQHPTLTESEALM